MTAMSPKKAALMSLMLLFQVSYGQQFNVNVDCSILPVICLDSNAILRIIHTSILSCLRLHLMTPLFLSDFYPLNTTWQPCAICTCHCTNPADWHAMPSFNAHQTTLQHM